MTLISLLLLCPLISTSPFESLSLSSLFLFFSSHSHHHSFFFICLLFHYFSFYFPQLSFLPASIRFHLSLRRSYILLLSPESSSLCLHPSFLSMKRSYRGIRGNDGGTVNRLMRVGGEVCMCVTMTAGSPSANQHEDQTERISNIYAGSKRDAAASVHPDLHYLPPPPPAIIFTSITFSVPPHRFSSSTGFSFLSLFSRASFDDSFLSSMYSIQSYVFFWTHTNTHT